jgi:hypothetical protein
MDLTVRPVKLARMKIGHTLSVNANDGVLGQRQQPAFSAG